ncbi:hypothetical protein HPB50_018656 [Hyalomma asiaticum]|uniref:Uncharacterized protein n=1 Tax=Hyalomma asiaticum TaxID=266040 RepID=A0ACB7SH27_HYAAI|nr:hypothetical protein HPB50_018656 [Hyalomma asiaticum]
MTPRTPHVAREPLMHTPMAVVASVFRHMGYPGFFRFQGSDERALTSFLPVCLRVSVHTHARTGSRKNTIRRTQRQVRHITAMADAASSSSSSAYKGAEAARSGLWRHAL